LVKAASLSQTTNHNFLCKQKQVLQAYFMDSEKTAKNRAFARANKNSTPPLLGDCFVLSYLHNLKVIYAKEKYVLTSFVHIIVYLIVLCTLTKKGLSRQQKYFP